MERERWNEAAAAAFLAARGMPCGPAAVRRLDGGYWNDVFRADLGGRRVVLKRYRAVLEGTIFPNLPAAEAAALDRLAGLGVAPDPVGFWPEAGVLVYAYVPGEPWSGDLAAVAALLRRKEAADPAGFRPVPATPAAILAEGDGLLAACGGGPGAAELAALRPVPVMVPEAPRRSLIHTDIGAGNLIGFGDGLRLIDWQCPAAGDLAEDVFSFLSPAFQILNGRSPLSPQDRRKFFHFFDMPAVEARLEMLEPAFAWRMAAYCLRRRLSAPEPVVRDRYARALAAETARLQAIDPRWRGAR